MNGTIEVMSNKTGHDEWKFDPANETDVRDIKRKMKDLFDKGYYAYAYNPKTGKHTTLQPSKLKTITDAELTRFIMVKDRKRVIQMPVKSG